MDLLIVEDGQYKVERVLEFINSNFDFDDISISYSYSSGVKMIVEKKPNIVILDMSLPTFDAVNGLDGGEKRMYGGLDIARQIKRRKINSAFLFLTQHQSFTENPKLEKLTDIHSMAKENYGSLYLGYIYYEHSGYEWKNKLKTILDEYVQNISN